MTVAVRDSATLLDIDEEKFHELFKPVDSKELRAARARELDDQGVIDLIEYMFKQLRSDYKMALKYIREHEDDDPDDAKMIMAIKMKLDCESFVKTPLYHAITDCDGGALLKKISESMEEE